MEGLQGWREHIGAAMQCLSRSPSNRLIFVTPIIDIRIIDVHDDIAAEMREIVNGFKLDLRHSLASTGRIKRGTRWAGAIEWDLLHPNLLGGKRKRELAEAFGVDFAALKPKQRVLVTHAHIVVDTRGHQSNNEVMSALARQWPGPYRVVSRTLHADKTVCENLERLAGYCTKIRMRYSQSWLGTRTEYGPNFELEWRDTLMRLISFVGLEAMTVSNVVSRAKHTVCKCTSFPPKTTVPQRFLNGRGGSQLMMDGKTYTTNVSMQKVHHTIIGKMCNDKRRSRIAITSETPAPVIHGRDENARPYGTGYGDREQDQLKDSDVAQIGTSPATDIRPIVAGETPITLAI